MSKFKMQNDKSKLYFQRKYRDKKNQCIDYIYIINENILLLNVIPLYSRSKRKFEHNAINAK